MPVPPSAPLAWRARIQHDGRVTDAARLAELIRERQPCVVLTGAGVSTESGIPDFRSPHGLWAQFDPFEYGSIDAFRADPAKVWRFYAPRFALLTEAEPNAAHRALARLEQAGGLVRAVITQNIDLLHERAGSRDVVEVHGSIRTSSCPGCGASYPLARVLELLAGELGRPDVVVLDPPRTGAGREVLTAILATGPRAVIYVACDPAALARDVRIALDAGWRMAELSAFDAFPMTHHVECIAVLRPQTAGSGGPAGSA